MLSQQDRFDIIALIKYEVTPAIGFTEANAVALAVAKC
jgi:L-cysteine desulfidase